MKSLALALALAIGCLASASAVTPGTKPRPSQSHTDNAGCPAPTQTQTQTPTTANPPHTTPGPSECGVTTTHTWYGNKTIGCQYDPLGDFCIADAILTLPCGCTKATNVVQQTTTVCATVPSAVNCRTGFMFTTTSTNC